MNTTVHSRLPSRRPVRWRAGTVALTLLPAGVKACAQAGRHTSFGGAGGSRTRVQTRKSSAFYKFILQLIFDQEMDEGAQLSGLFPYLTCSPGLTTSGPIIVRASIQKGDKRPFL